MEHSIFLRESGPDANGFIHFNFDFFFCLDVC